MFQSFDSQNIKFKHLTLRALDKAPFGVHYQVRLSVQFSRRTIGVGNDKLAAINAAKALNDHIEACVLTNQQVDLDDLRRLADTFKPTKNSKVRLVEKSDIQSLWNEYVAFHQRLNLWEQSYLLTHIATITNMLAICPIQKLEDKGRLVDWFFSDSRRHPKTSKDRFKLVVACVDWSSKQGLIPRNWGIEYRDLLSSISVKVAKSKSSKNEENEIEILKVSEVYQILDALKNDTFSRFQGKHSQYYEIIYFLWLTGCRPNEAIALKWDNVDLHKKQITFNEGEVLASGKVIKKRGTKTVASRKFPVNSELKNLLTSNFINGSKYVFENDKNEPISHQALRRVWNLVLSKLGIKHRNLYQLRHSFISYHANNDYPLHKLAELVGNSEKVIKEHYLKLDIERIQLPDVIKSN